VSRPDASASLGVALLHFAYWPEVRRGTERLVHDLGRDLSELGHRPRIVTSHAGSSTYTVEEGVPVIRNRRPPETVLRHRGFQDHVAHLPFSYRSLRRGDDDVAHAFYPTDALAALRWRRRTGRPVVTSLLGIPERAALSNLRNRLRIFERATRDADAVVVLGPAARDATWRWLGVEARIIAPGVDLARFTPGGERTELPTIASAAAPDDPRKRVGLLVRGFRRLRRERPDVHLRLTRPRDPAMLRELEAEPGVELHELTSDEVPELFRSAWLSALTSRQEAFGLVVVESLACGTPAVGPDDGGVREIIDRPEVGRLFAGDDEVEVARALAEALELAEDPGTAAACRARAEAFSTIASARAHEALYRELLASG
jgi:glycosyltransferase involved in cell wall biosynthesis